MSEEEVEIKDKEVTETQDPAQEVTTYDYEESSNGSDFQPDGNIILEKIRSMNAFMPTKEGYSSFYVLIQVLRENGLLKNKSVLKDLSEIKKSNQEFTFAFWRVIAEKFNVNIAMLSHDKVFGFKKKGADDFYENLNIIMRSKEVEDQYYIFLNNDETFTEQGHIQFVQSGEEVFADIRVLQLIENKNVNLSVENCLKQCVFPESINEVDLKDLIDIEPKAKSDSVADKREWVLNFYSKLQTMLFKNKNFFPAGIINQVAPIIMIIGDEKQGKSTTLSNVIGEPINFSQHQVATRCPIFYSICHDEKVKTEKGCMVDIDDQTFVQGHFPKNKSDCTPTQAIGVITDIMNYVKDNYPSGVTSKNVFVNIRTSRKITPSNFVDFPGLTSDSANYDKTQSKNTTQFSGEVFNICQSSIRQYVLPNDSKSWAFCCVKFESKARSQNWGRIFKGQTQNLGIIITHIDDMSVKFIENRLEQNNLEYSDKGVFDLLTADLKGFIDENKTPIFFCANQNVNDAMKDYVKTKNLIHNESIGGPDSKTKSFLDMIESLPSKINGFKRNVTYFNKIVNSTGIGTIKDHFHHIQTAGIERLGEFLNSFFREIEETTKGKAAELKETFVNKGFNNVFKPTDLIKRVLKTSVSLFHYVLTGENIPLSGDMPKFSCVNMVDILKWKEILVDSSRSLREDISSCTTIKFPQNISPDIETYILDKLDPQNKQVSTIQERISRVVDYYLIKTHLCIPEKKTWRDIERSPNYSKHIQSYGRESFIESVVQEFIFETAKLGSTYLAELLNNILESAIQTVINGLKTIEPFIHLFPNETNLNDEFQNELAQFLRVIWIKPVTDIVKEKCYETGIEIAVPMNLKMPSLLSYGADLLPKGTAFKKSLHEFRNKQNEQLLMEDTEKVIKLNNKSDLIKGDEMDMEEVQKKKKKNEVEIENNKIRLVDVEGKKEIVDQLSIHMVTQNNHSFPDMPSRRDVMFQTEVDHINHIVLKQCKSVITLYGIMIQLIIPKSVRKFVKSSFLASDYFDYFLYFINKKSNFSTVDGKIQISTANKNLFSLESEEINFETFEEKIEENKNSEVVTESDEKAEGILKERFNLIDYQQIAKDKMKEYYDEFKLIVEIQEKIRLWIHYIKTTPSILFPKEEIDNSGETEDYEIGRAHV